MNIIVIGAGNMGAAFVKQLHARRPSGDGDRPPPRESAGARRRASGRDRGGRGQCRRPQADVIVLATGYGDAVSALKSIGDLRGKSSSTSPIR